MDVDVVREYWRYRRENPWVPAAMALGMAVRVKPPVWAEGFECGPSVWEVCEVGHVDGWDVTITAVVDDDPDRSWIGQWTDQWSDGVVDNPDGWTTGAGRRPTGKWKYFLPSPDRIPDDDELVRRGMSRGQRAVARHNAALAAIDLYNQDQYIVRVTVSRDRMELGCDSLGGVFMEDLTDLLWTVQDLGMIGQAIAGANATLAGVLSRAGVGLDAGEIRVALMALADLARRVGCGAVIGPWRPVVAKVIDRHGPAAQAAIEAEGERVADREQANLEKWVRYTWG